MTSRYDPADSEPPPLPPRSPLEPVPLVSKRTTVAAALAVVLAASVSVGAAFGFDVCAFLHSVGLELDACKVKPVSPAELPAP